MSSFRTRSAQRFGILSGAALALTLATAVAVPAGATSSVHPLDNGGATDVGVTASSINIGATDPLTGLAAPGYDEVAPAAKAVFNYINGKGGIAGRKINFNILNDSYDTGQNGVPSTVTQTNVLINSPVFAVVGSLGTPTGDSVRSTLSQDGIPQLFQNSGSTDWNHPNAYPKLFGWQPDYVVEGKILGAYVKKHYGTSKVGFLGQDDDFGSNGLAGLQDTLGSQIPSGGVVNNSNPLIQSYDAATVAIVTHNVNTQIAALKSAGAKVVVLDTIPGITNLALKAAANDKFSPTWVISSVGSDPQTVNNKTENGAISFTWLPPLGTKTTAWTTWASKVLKGSGLPGDPSGKNKVMDGNVEYGIGWGVTFAEAVYAVTVTNHQNLTRNNLVNFLENSGSSLPTPALVPLAYSRSDHQGYEGGEVITISTAKNTATAVAGTLATTTDSSNSAITPTAGVAQAIPSWLN